MMPTIPIYTAPNAPIEIPNRGVEALATAGRRLGQLGNERAQEIRQGGDAIARGAEELGASVTAGGKLLQAKEGDAEILNLGAQAATLKTQLNQKWQQTLAGSDPTDPKVLENFQSNVVEPAYTDLASSANTPEGRRWAADHAAQEMDSFGHQIQAGQAQLVNTQAHAAYDTARDHLMYHISQDPLHLSDNLNTLRQLRTSYMNAVGGTMDAEASAKWAAAGHEEDQQAIKNAYIAQLNPLTGGNPNQDMTAFKQKYGPILGGAGTEELDRTQNTYQEQALKNSRETTEANKQIQAAQWERNSQAALGGLVGPDGQYAGAPATQDWRLHVLQQISTGQLSSEAGGRVLNVGDRFAAAQGKDVEDEQTFQHYLQLSGRPRGDPTRPTADQIYDTMGRGLDMEHGRFLLSILDKKSPQDIIYNQQFSASVSNLASQVGGSPGSSAVQAAAANEVRNQFTQGWMKAVNGGYQEEYLGLTGNRSYTKTLDIDAITKAARTSAVHPVAVPPTTSATGYKNEAGETVRIPAKGIPPAGDFFKNKPFNPPQDENQ